MSTEAQDSAAFNLAGATDQDVFDYVVRKLIEQGEPSTKDGMCLFRGPGDRRCAVGWLIPDDEYTPAVDQQGGVGSLLNKDVAPPSLLSWVNEGVRDLRLPSPQERVRFLSDLQIAHDGTEAVRGGTWTDAFRDRARFVGELHGLTTTVTY